MPKTNKSKPLYATNANLLLLLYYRKYIALHCINKEYPIDKSI